MSKSAAKNKKKREAKARAKQDQEDTGEVHVDVSWSKVWPFLLWIKQFRNTRGIKRARSTSTHEAIQLISYSASQSSNQFVSPFIYGCPFPFTCMTSLVYIHQSDCPLTHLFSQGGYSQYTWRWGPTELHIANPKNTRAWYFMPKIFILKSTSLKYLNTYLFNQTDFKT